MKNNTILKYIGVSLVLLIPLPGRFCYGLPILFILNFLMIITTLLNKAIYHLELDTLKPVLLIYVLISLTVFLRQILILISPTIALALGFLIYLPCIAILMLGNFFENKYFDLKTSIKSNMTQSGIFTLYALLFFIIREVLGYGTISIPSSSGIAKLIIPNFFDFSPFIFFASIPGGLILTGLLLTFMTFIQKNIFIIAKSTDLQSNELKEGK